MNDNPDNVGFADFATSLFATSLVDKTDGGKLYKKKDQIVLISFESLNIFPNVDNLSQSLVKAIEELLYYRRHKMKVIQLFCWYICRIPCRMISAI